MVRHARVRRANGTNAGRGQVPTATSSRSTPTANDTKTPNSRSPLGAVNIGVAVDLAEPDRALLGRAPRIGTVGREPHQQGMKDCVR